MDDLRPLTTEPLPLDVVNTLLTGGRDFLADDAWAQALLRKHGLPDDVEQVEPLRAARAAARDLLERGDAAALNAVLARGRERLELDEHGSIHRTLELEDCADEAAWRVAAALVELFSAEPDRIRACEHPDCVLWFHDTSKAGRRRWCTMAGCGNRAKSARHYARSRKP